MNWKAGDRFKVEGDAAELWLKDYNVRVATEGTIEETPAKNAKKVLVTLDAIDGEGKVCAAIRISKLRLIA